MRYDNSLTSNVQNYIESTLAKKLSAAQEYLQVSSAARDVRSYLCDSSTVNTPDFVIRRYIQSKHTELLPKKIEIPNLLKSNNVPWEPEILDSLAEKLFRLSIDRGTGISKAEWKRYLSGNGVSKREKVFQISFTLGMDIDSSIDLFLAFDMEACSTRYPLDLICLFCLHNSDKYTWSEAKEMLDQFLAAYDSQTADVLTPTHGMTRQIATELDAILAKSLPDADKKEELLKYMAEHCSEFVSYKTTVAKARRDDKGKAVKDKDGKTVKDKVEETVFLHGYSLSRMKMFMRLSEYLAILYPNYSWQEEKEPNEQTEDKDLKDWGPGLPTIVSVEFNKLGKPKLPSLIRATFFHSGWSDIVWNKENNKADFDNGMRKLCQNFEKHMMAIDRLQTGGNSVAFFERRDALLFVYFLINGYLKLVFDNTEEAKITFGIIDDMLNSGDDFDYVIAEALEKAEYVFQNSDDDSLISERFSSLLESFNLILTQLDYTNIYLPARFDRFIVLALLSATPDELTPLIMCQEELEYYESQS